MVATELPENVQNMFKQARKSFATGKKFKPGTFFATGNNFEPGNWVTTGKFGEPGRVPPTGPGS